MTLQLALRTVPRLEILDDDGEGRRLSGWVREAASRGGAPVVAVVLRRDRIDLIGIGPVLEAGVPLPAFLAGLSRSSAEEAGPVDAVGMMGVARVRRAPEPPDRAVPMAMAFLEWEDCRWWHWRALLDASTSTIRDDSEIVQRAEDGDPLPDAFGRWWSLGRRAGMIVRMSRAEQPAPDPPGSQLVH